MIIAITSVGLSLIFGTTGLSNFAHGEMVTLGALIAWGFNRSWASWSLIAAALVAIVVTAVVGGLFELGVWRPLRHRGTSLTSMMIVSIGIALAARHLYLFLVGGASSSTASTRCSPTSSTSVRSSTPPRSLWIIGISGAVIIGVALFLLRARFGKAIRAVSDNPELASSSGIDSDRVILLVWILGGALAGLGGVMYGLEYGIRWDMGFTLLLLMFAAITLGGLGNPFGALDRLAGDRDLRRAVDVRRPQRQRHEERRGAGRPDHHPADPSAGNPRQQGADRVNWELIFWNALYTSINAGAAAYCLIAVGLNVHVGYTGLLNFGQAGFAAVGAYAFAIPIVEYDWPWYAALAARVRLLDRPRPRCSASRRCACAPTTWRSSRSPPPRSSATSSARRGSRWLTGGTDGRQGWTELLPGPQPVGQRRPLLARCPDLRRLPAVHDGPRVVARRRRRRCSCGR